MTETPHIGPYSLLRKLSVSDIAVSFAAEMPTDARSRRLVALKVLDPECSSDPAFSAQLKQDAELVESLNHINIGQTWDLARRDGVFYLCLEYIEGCSLRDLLDRTGPAPPAVAAFIVSEIAGALSYAHARRSDDLAPDGIVHADLRPRKVIISRNGSVKLVDFAVSRARKFAEADPVHASKRETEIMAYTSPSVARGGIPSTQSDIFAAAAIAYRLLVGRRLYNGSTYQEVHGQAIDGAFPSLSDIAPDCPAELAEIVMRGLGASDKPAYSTAQAFRSSLSSWVRKHAIGFGRHKVKEHFSEYLDATLVERGARPLTRREFEPIDGATLIHGGVDRAPADNHVSLRTLYENRHARLEAVSDLTPSDDAAIEPSEESVAAEMAPEHTTLAFGSRNPEGGRLEKPRRAATQAMIPNGDLEDIDLKLPSDKPAAPPKAPPTKPTESVPMADSERTFRETLGKTSKSDGAPLSSPAERAPVPFEAEPTVEGDDASALDELLGESSIGGFQDRLKRTAGRQGTHKFSPQQDVFDDESESRPDKARGSRRRDTREIEPTLRDGTAMMGTVNDVYDEEPPHVGGASTAKGATTDEHAAFVGFDKPEDTPRGVSSSAPAPVRDTGAFYDVHEEDTEVPGPGTSYSSVHSDEDAESAIYGSGRRIAGDTDIDESDLRKPGRGSLGYVILIVAILGLSAGAWYLYREIQSIQDAETPAESQGIFVTSRPQGAQIYVDDRIIDDTTPAVVPFTELGRPVRVHVEIPGYETPPSKQATTSADRQPKLEFELRPLPHLIHVESQPEGAEIYLSGDLVGTTPADVGPVRVNPNDGVKLLLIHPELGRKSVAHSWQPGSERSRVDVNLTRGATIE